MENESALFIKKARQVYFSLVDEESKEVFKKRKSRGCGVVEHIKGAVKLN